MSRRILREQSLRYRLVMHGADILSKTRILERKRKHAPSYRGMLILKNAPIERNKIFVLIQNRILIDKLGGEFKKTPVLLRGGRKSDESFLDIRIVFAERRNELKSDFVSAINRLAVGMVDSWLKTLLIAVCFYFISEYGKKRSYDVDIVGVGAAACETRETLSGSFIRNTRKSVRTGTSHDSHEHRLRLIVRILRNGNSYVLTLVLSTRFLCHFDKRFVSKVSARFFCAYSFFSGSSFAIKGIDPAFQSVLARIRFAEGLIAIGRLAPQIVIDVNGIEPKI